LVAPSTAQIPAALIPVLTFYIGSVGFVLDAVNLVTGVVGIPAITIQSILSGIIGLAAPGIEQDILDGICTPLNDVLGEVGVCACNLVDGASSIALVVGISCVPADGTADYCFDAPDATVCGPINVSGQVVVPITEAGLAIIDGGNIEVKAVPIICITMNTPAGGDEEELCATGEVVQSISLTSPDDFDPTSIEVENPSVTIQKVNDDAVECVDVTVGKCVEDNKLSFFFDCTAQSDKLTAVQCLDLSSSP